MFKYFTRITKIMSFLGKTIPNAIADGQITIEECVSIVKELFYIFDVKSFIVPDKIQKMSIEVSTVAKQVEW